MENQFSLKDKVIIVTGATGVIGEAFIHSIAEAGGIVGVMGRNEAIAHERAAKITEQGGKAIALIADVTKEDQLIAARERILKEYGQINGLVNAAGGNIPEAIVQNEDDIFNLNMQGMKDVMDLNLMGTLLPTQVFGPTLVKSKGSIVNISSVTAHRALTKVMGYSLAKAAIECYTQWFAVELANRYGDSIRMNAIVPGFVLTEQNRTLLTSNDGSLTERGNLIIQHTPFNRFSKADELNGALIWLLSDASKFVTGTFITVDGGYSAFGGL